MLLLVWFREKEREEGILRALTGDAPGGGLDSSHVDGDTTHSSWRKEAISVGGGPNGDTETRGGGAAASPVSQQQRPAPFDGKLAWDAYRTQFELLAMMNRWSDTEKAAYLAITLRGPAATVLTNLPPEQRGSYEALITALDTRFGLSHQTELNRMWLKARTRCRDASLAELVEDVEHLVPVWPILRQLKLWLRCWQKTSL